MAFDYTNLYPDTSANGGYTKSWNYTTVVDSIATCSASGYFNKVATRLGIGDNIVIARVDAFDTKNRTTLVEYAELFVIGISAGVVTTTNYTTGMATTAYVDAGDAAAAAATALKANIASPTFTGIPAAPTAAVDTNTTQLATTAMVLAQAASATPIVNGVAAVGTSTRFARGDHVHPTDTTKVATVKKQVFTASGTYTPSTGMLYCVIECVGSGAGGGGTTGTVGGAFAAGGGGAGSYSRLVATAATIGGSQTVTVGNPGTGGATGSNNGTAGSDVSVGTLCIGKGGSPGGFSASGTFGPRGAGGVAGTGDITLPGGAGAAGLSASIATVFFIGGNGGSSHLGAGGIQATPVSAASSNGVAGSNYGAGGSGGHSQNTATTASGGDGSKGVVFITEFCAQ